MDTLPANDATAAVPSGESSTEECAGRPSIPAEAISESSGFTLPETLRHELWLKSSAGKLGWAETQFGVALETIAAKCNFGLDPNRQASEKQQETFWRGLHLEDLALARACALGHEIAWQHFMTRCRAPIVRVAQGLARSAARGEELADALFGELYVAGERTGERHSPLDRYSGRGSLMSWLRAMMAQQLVNQYRKTHRETALDDAVEPAAPDSAEPEAKELGRVRDALPAALAGLAAEERFLLSAYYLDGHSLQEVGRVLGVHEATVSRKLKRSTQRVRKALLKALTAGGLSGRAAQEALGIDPRDVDVNMRKLLQEPAGKTYPDTEGKA